jgi:hypothetical protein
LQRQTALWHGVGFVIAVHLPPFRICFRPFLRTHALGLFLLLGCSQARAGAGNFKAQRRNETATTLQLIVTNTADSGAGSLRAAIASSNAAPPPTGSFNTITFSISPSDPGYANGVANVTLTSSELLIQAPVAIKGPGADRLTVQRTKAEGAARFRIFDNADGVTSQISGLTMANGDVSDYGGGIFVDGGNLAVSDCIITENRADAGGAGVALYGHPEGHSSGLGRGTLTITNCLIKGNSCGFQPGGGVLNKGGDGTTTNLVVAGSTIENNIGGGGIYNMHGFGTSTASVVDCIVRGNVGPVGGGIGNDGAEMTIRNSTISGNIALYGNSGVINSAYGGQHSKIVLSNSTIADNVAQIGSTAGVQNQAHGAGTNATVTLNNCTIAGNSAPSVSNATSGLGGGIYNHAMQNGTSAIILNGTIVANNFAASSGDEIYNHVETAGSASVDGSYNVVGTLGGYSFVSGSNNLLGVNPMFEKDDRGSPLLKDNGGRTQTVALLSGSPAIDAGDPGNILRRDQRGYARAGRSDVGAYESEGTALRISQIARDKSDLAVTFDALAGETYRLERALDLASANWEAAPGAADFPAVSDGSAQMIDHEALVQAGAYYRLRLLP